MPSVTLSMSNSEMAVIRKAYGVYLRLGRDATAKEIKEELIRTVNDVVTHIDQPVQAAEQSVTLSMSNSEAARIHAAYGVYLRLGRDATGEDIKEYLVRQLRGVVRNAERRQAEAEIQATADIVVT